MIQLARNLKRLTLKEQAEKALREMITSYRFTPGKWINIERLAKELGVSRTPIYQALKKLEEEGLVIHIPKRGIRMAEMTLQMAHDLYVVRELLEDLATRLAADCITPQALRRMERILKKQHHVVKNYDLIEYSKSTFEFHISIYDSCGNWILRELLYNIKNRSQPIMINISSILPLLYQDHLRIFYALKKHDPDKAGRAIRAHIARIRMLIESELNAKDASRLAQTNFQTTRKGQKKT